MLIHTRYKTHTLLFNSETRVFKTFFPQSMSEDKLREEVIELLEDKEKYQEAAKEALRKSMTDKMEAVKKCQELERYVLSIQSLTLNTVKGHCKQSTGK